MKRTILSIALLFFLTKPVLAQFLVEGNGNVAVKPTTDPVQSYFSINSPGYSNATSYMLSNNSNMDVALWLVKSGTPNTSHDFSIGFDSDVYTGHNATKKAFGLYTHVWKSSGDSNSGRSYGVYAVSGNATNGYNYGVFGTLYGNNNGAGVFGSSVSSDAGLNTCDRFAGFFHGDIKVTDAIYANDLYVPADYELEDIIEPFKSDCIDDIMNLNVVRYNFRQRVVDTGDTTTTPINYYTDDSKLLQRTHYGLIAQELQEIYPDLVYKGGDGYLSVNYLEIIPILIKTIQELKNKVDYLANTPNKSAQNYEETTKATNLLSPILFQNDPNPFTENTEIKSLIPINISNATLYIYDMNGLQIEKRIITERGNVSLTIEGSSLKAGMYLYSLITDGKVIDTKRMILTK